MSSHPAACIALLEVNPYEYQLVINPTLIILGYISTIRLEFTKGRAQEIMKAPPHPDTLCQRR